MFGEKKVSHRTIIKGVLIHWLEYLKFLKGDVDETWETEKKNPTFKGLMDYINSIIDSNGDFIN